MTEHNHDSNINESTINENPEDKHASDEAAAQAQEPAEGLESTPGDDTRMTPEKFAEAARKAAAETAYAAAGFAGLVGEKAKAFYEEQRKQYADAHPDEDQPKAKAFLDQLAEQLNHFADDLARGYKDMVERGRSVVQGNTQTKHGETGDASSGTSAPDSPDNDGESPLSGDEPAFSSDLSDDVSGKTPGTDDVLQEPGKQDGIL